MSTATALPPSLRDQLATVTRRLRLLRAVRGLSWLVLVLALTAAGAILADVCFNLPALVRGMWLAIWLTLGGSILLFRMVVPLCRRIDHEAVAAAVEEKYPYLGERLTTSVELAGDANPFHGSPTLVALLMRETEARTQRLNFLVAFPAGTSKWLAVVAALVLLVVLAPAAIWPEQTAAGARRLFFPWQAVETLPPYTLDVTPGDTFVARGRALSLAVQIQRRNDSIALPRSCTFVQIDAAGTTTRRRMLSDRSDAFSIKIDKVPGDFRYHIEADAVASDDYQVTAVEPVELAADSPTVIITPPAYAKATVEPQTIHGVADLSALQHSQVAFEFQFTRPAVTAVLEWTPRTAEAGKNKDTAQVTALALSPDQRSGRFEMPAASEGTFKLVLAAEHGIRTELDPHLLVVKIDQPPAFIKVAGNDELKAVQPYETLPLEVHVADDVGVDLAEVEYRVNDGASAFKALALQGRGTRDAVGRLRFELSGKVKEGDTLQYRFKAADNRRVPEAGLGPNVVYHPAESAPGQPRWRTLKIARQAEPLRQQEIVAQRDEVNRRIDAIQRKLYEERAAVLKLRAEALDQPLLTRPQEQQLGDIRKQNRSAEIDLWELAREAAEVPDLQPVAERAGDIADKEMRRSDQDLSRAEKQTVPEPRDHQLQEAGKELAAATRRLDELRRQNDQRAQARLDQMKLENLASRQQQLADRVADEAAQDPVKDPMGQDNLRDLQRDQSDLARDLEQQAAQNEALRKALEAARAEKAKQLAEQARELAQAERDLARAARDTEQRRQQERFADLAQQQQELADRAKHLAQETRPSAQAAKANPLRPEEAQKAAEALKQGNADDALRRQEQAAQALERHAADLAKAIELASDPREAARQLARLQEDLRKRLADESKNKSSAKPSTERLKEVRAEEKAIQRAAEQLSVPEQNPAAVKDRQEAASQAAQAADALDKQNPRQADECMTQARQSLNRLADRLPSLEQRRRQAVAEVARLRQQQEETARQAEQAVKQVEKEDAGSAQARAKLAPKLAESARREADVGERLGKIDTPNQEARRARTQDAVNRAHADLKAARPQDVTASQQDARRELEHLEQALSGQKPADELARELANRQQQLAEQASRQTGAPKTTPQQQQEVQRRQDQIARETQALAAPEAPQHQREAAEATRRAADAARSQPAAPQTQQEMGDAARALDRLARQMTGQEADAARAERLARRQAEAAKEAERLAKKPTRPASNPEAQRNQKEIAEEAKQLRAGDQGQTEKQKALQALTRAQQPAKQQDEARSQRQAADALHALADRLARQAAGQERPPVVRAQASDLSEAAPRGLPNPKQAEQARQLAQEQRDLRAAVQRLAAAPAPSPAPGANPIAELAKQQAQIARKAADLARNVAKDQGQQAAPSQKAQEAAQSTKRASNQLQAGALPAAHQAGTQAAGQLRQLAQQVSQTPRGNADPKAPDPVQRARQLAVQQEELNRRLQPLAQQSAAQQAQQQARQQDLREQTGELAQGLNGAVQQNSPPQAAQAMRGAALMSQQAQAAMQHAQEQSRQGNQNVAQPLRQHAAQALDQAARMADQAAQQMAARPNNAQPSPADQQAGQAVDKAQGHMREAQSQLGQNQKQNAQGAMNKAAQSLQQAARELAQRQPGRPDPNSRSSDLGAAGGGRPDESLFAKDMKKYGGKPWGELPGELRTKIIQDMKAKYGDDYGRMIKLYFEQVADHK